MQKIIKKSFALKIGEKKILQNKINHTHTHNVAMFLVFFLAIYTSKSHKITQNLNVYYLANDLCACNKNENWSCALAFALT